MELKEDTRYTYAVARIRALETRFLTREKIQRITETADAITAWRETAGWHLLPKRELSIENAESDLEKFLMEEAIYINNLFSSLSNDPELTNLFFLKYDFHNLKVLLKAFQQSSDDYTVSNLSLIDAGLVPMEKLKKAISEKNFGELPLSLQDVVAETLTAMKDDTHPFHGRPEMVDIVLDKKMFDLIFKTLEEYRAPFFLKMLFQTEVDIHNLNICRRFKYLKRNRDFLNETLLSGGKLDVKFLLEKYEKNEESAFNEFINLQLSTLNFQLSSLYESARYTAFGLEPLVAFLKKREKESTIVRMIILAKLKGLEPEAIREEIAEVCSAESRHSGSGREAMSV